MIPNKVKLVVWDLDETFWRGTLSEEGIVAVDRNIDMVRELSKRGIINSICSKNDFEQAKAKLIDLDIWDFFVFPSISFHPKGKAVAEMIEGAALRAENTLFIDDNRLNLEEVKFFNAGIMTAHPDDVLGGLLDHAHLAGKPDPELTRLKQYRFLQRKVEERSTSDLSNEEFLRASNIRIRIDYDIESNFERILDLINRANQLNYTKKRIETPEDVADFRESLNAFGVQAGCVHAADSYGDYGLIGFFLQKRRFKTNKLVHFVFSCRTMNMGIEQYVYETIGRPDIDIVEPVSYGLDSHAAVDWIETGDDAKQNGRPTDLKLVLVGGCDLLQLASYCSTSRTEFVNAQQNGAMIRYDDPGFILSDRAATRASEVIRQISCWKHEDAVRFDESVAGMELMVISMWASLNAQYLKTSDGVTLSLKKDRIEELQARPQWFEQNIERLELDDAGKIDLVLASFDSIAARCSPQSQIFVLGSYTQGPRAQQIRRRRPFNDRCRAYCEKNAGQFRFVDLDTAVPAETLVGNQHFSRMGYFALAQHILRRAATSSEPPLVAS